MERNKQHPRPVHRQVIYLLLLALALLTVTGCGELPPPEDNQAGVQTAGTDRAAAPQQPHETEPIVVPGLGVKVELADHSFDAYSFRVYGIPNGYQVWATITDDSHENYLVFDNEGLHVAEITIRYEPGKLPQIAPMERYKLHFEKLKEFPVWEVPSTADQPPAPGLATEFTDGRFGYRVTTRGEQLWLLDGWTFKSTEALSCSGPEMCPEYRCICSYDASGLPRIATGDRLACINAHCVAPAPCEEFCLTIDFGELGSAQR
jgi:hypothetical protein